MLNGEISQLFSQTDVILSSNRDNIEELKSVNHQISTKLQTMDTTLNELLVELMDSLTRMRHSSSINRFGQFETVPYKPERAGDLINQMNGYLNSIDIDNERRRQFRNILNATKALDGLVDKGLNEFVSSLESCIGSFGN
ncbi:hypothetical protein CLIB1444_04S09868 [[Candida] jaroonii]|uniref:Uncharacterized protein n=1 Tax=[Candida] jaroonii TaxID=467808 RepID=A0ACA9Y7Y7_9ASCO|nr:hypothetical protein CLIB1444_04S09868 [[Candida] jaroonii]